MIRRWLDKFATKKFVAERYESDMANVLSRLEHIARRQVEILEQLRQIRQVQAGSVPKWRETRGVYR